MIDQSCVGDSDGRVTVIKEPFCVRVIEESRAAHVDHGDAEAAARVRGHEAIPAAGNTVGASGEIEITIPVGVGDPLVACSGDNGAWSDGHRTGSLIIGAGGTGDAGLARGEKRHVGSDIDDHLAAGTGRGHVQLRGARTADHGGIHVESAA